MSVRIILNFFVAISVVCLFNLNSSAQPSGGGAIMAIDERTLAGGGAGIVSNPVSVATAQTTRATKKTSGTKKTTIKKTTTPKTNQTASSKTNQTSSKKATPKPPTPKKYDGFVIGDDHTLFNFEIVKAVQPLHTIAAQEAGAKGLVQVEVLIDVNGSVLEVRARSGNKLLHPEAEKAALATKFRQFSVYGKPARAFGFIVFRFGRRED